LSYAGIVQKSVTLLQGDPFQIQVNDVFRVFDPIQFFSHDSARCMLSVRAYDI